MDLQQRHALRGAAFTARMRQRRELWEAEARADMRRWGHGDFSGLEMSAWMDVAALLSTVEVTPDGR